MPQPTRLMTMLGLDVPVICAPLGRGSTPHFLAALANAGSLGFVALAHALPDRLDAQLRQIGAETRGRYGVNFSLISDQSERLRRALDAGAPMVSFWQDDPERYVRIAKDAGATVFWTVGHPSEARRARDIGVDILVAQGAEAGGHLVGRAPIMSLLPAVVDAAGGLPVAAAGGIADGRGLAAALALGAEGVWIGTRFVASEEAELHDGYKRQVVGADFNDLVETRLFDGEWEDSPHRVLRNSVVRAWEGAGCPAPGSRPDEGAPVGEQPDGTAVPTYHVSCPARGFRGDWERTALYAGYSAGLVHDVVPVAEILSRFVADASRAASRTSATLASRSEASVHADAASA